MASNEALYSVKVQADSSALEQVQKNVDALKSPVTLKVDAGLAAPAIDGLKQSIAGISGANVHVGVDTAAAASALAAFETKATESVKPIKDLEAELAGLKQIASSETNIAFLAEANDKIKETEAELKRLKSVSAESLSGEGTEKFEGKLDGLKDKAKDALSGIGAGFLAGGLAVGLDKALDAGKEELEAQEKLKIALRQTGVEGDALNKKFEESEAQAKKLADTYALPVDTIREMQTEIAGLGGLSGAQADKVQQIGIAFSQLGISSRALKGILSGANDPESTAALDSLKTKFGALAPALAGATTSGEKMDAILKVVTPTLDGMKEAADGPLGGMQKMDETGKQLEKSIGLLLFSVLTPLIPVLTGVASIVNGAIIPAFTALGTFIDNNKVSFAILAIGIGAVAIAMNTATISTTAFGIAEKVQAAATGIVTGAQTLLNTVMEANPIGLVVGAIALLAAGAVYLYNNVKPVHDAFDAVWTVLKGAGAFIGTFIKEYIGGLVTAFSGVGKVLDGIIHLNFDEVKAGAADVGKGVGNALGGAAVKGAQAFGQSVAESTAKLSEQSDAAKKAGEDGKSAADQAADAQKAYADSIAAANTAFAGAFDANTKKLDEDKQNYLRQQDAMNNGFIDAAGVRHALNDQEKAQYEASNASLLESMKTRVGINNEHKKDADTLNKELGPTKEKKGHEQDMLAIAKQNADQAAKQLEVKLRLADAEAGRVFSSKDELAVEEKRSTVLDDQIKKHDLLNNTKYSAKAQLEVDQNQIKTLEIEAKIKIDQKKAQETLDKAVEALQNKEIDLGLRPKSDATKALTAQIDKWQQELMPLQAKVILDPADTDSATKVANLKAQILDAQATIAKNGQDLNDQVQQSAIDIMKAGVEKDLAAEQEKYDKQIRQFLDFQGNKRQLSDQERELEANLEDAHQQAILTIKEKYAKKGSDNNVALEKATDSILSALFQDLTTKKQKINQADVADKELSYQKDETNLVASLKKGEIQQQEYSVKLSKLNADRASYEKGLEGQKWAGVKSLADGAYKDLEQSAENYLKQMVAKYVIDALFHSSTEQTKTAATVAGTATRVAANTQETASNVTNASSNLLGAVTDEIAKSIAFLGPIAGPIAGLATAGILMAAVSGFEKVLGFETGGLAVVGEKGPEVIGPAKDFSSFAASLVGSTTKAIVQQMTGQGQGQIRSTASRATRDKRQFQLTQKGRDLQYSLDRNGQSVATERLMPSYTT